jgi:hypothetical protein
MCLLLLRRIQRNRETNPELLRCFACPIDSGVDEWTCAIVTHGYGWLTMVTCRICGRRFSIGASECKCGADELEKWLSARPRYNETVQHPQRRRASRQARAADVRLPVSSVTQWVSVRAECRMRMEQSVCGGLTVRPTALGSTFTIR